MKIKICKLEYMEIIIKINIMEYLASHEYLFVYSTFVCSTALKTFDRIFNVHFVNLKSI